MRTAFSLYFTTVKRPEHAALDRQRRTCAVRRARDFVETHGFLLGVYHRLQMYVYPRYSRDNIAPLS